MSQDDRNDAAGGAALEATAHAAPAPEAVVQWKGRVLDERYKVTSLLGEGGMGAVYVAEHLTLHKPVAVKVIRKELAGNGEVATRFAREAMATAQFEHPHVASAIDYGTLPEGGAYFVMQLVRGHSLRRLLAREKKLPWRRACILAAQVADALSAAKAKGIIHRDLKPDNILVEQREDGSDLIKVLDFGIAHVAPRDAPAPEGAQAHKQLTRVGTVMGTPGYMPPEQAVGDTVDHRADLYALGVVLWECIAGRELWDAPDLTATITMQMSQPVPLLREEVDLTIPPGVDELVQKLIARDPERRPDHAGAVRDELRKLAHGGEATRPTIPLVPAIKDAVVPAVSTVVSRFRTQPQARQKQLIGGGLAALLLLVVVLASGDDDEAAPTAQAAQEAVAAAAEATEKVAGNLAAAAGDAEGEAPAQADGEKKKQGASPLDKIVEAAGDVVEALPGGGPDVPKALKEPVDEMLNAEGARARRRAAKKVLAHKPKSDVPEYLRNIASFEAARSCKARKKAITTMAEAPHPDYLEPLWRMRRAPKQGCGFLNLSDCYGCVRGNLRSAIADIAEKYPAAAARAEE